LRFNKHLDDLVWTFLVHKVNINKDVPLHTGAEVGNFESLHTNNDNIINNDDKTNNNQNNITGYSKIYTGPHLGLRSTERRIFSEQFEVSARV